MNPVGSGASLSVSLASLGVMGGVAYGLRATGIPGEVIAALASGVAALLPGLLVRVQERHKSQTDRLREIALGQVCRPPYLTALIAGLLMVLATGGVAFVAALAAAVTLVTVGQAWSPPVGAAVADRLYWLLMVPLLIPAGLLIGRYVARRLGRGRWWWLVSSVVLASVLLGVTSLGLQQVSGVPPTAASEPLVTLPMPGGLLHGLLLLLPALVGYWWGLRSQEGFLVQRLLRRLDRADRRAILELLGGVRTDEPAPSATRVS